MDLSKIKFPERFQAISRLMVLVVALLFAKVVSARVPPMAATEAVVPPPALPHPHAHPHPYPLPGSSPTWVDSLDDYARNKFLPAKKYNWTWQQSALLRAMTAQYDQKIGPNPEVYLNYVRTAIDRSMDAAWVGHNPNSVASGAGLAWLARVTGEAKYRSAAESLYQKYLQIPRFPNGAIWHLRRFAELWDDTIFMVGTYLLEMYLLTDDEKYLNELLLQVQTHREKLQVTDPNAPGAGLWVHGWDGDDKDHCRLCSQQHWDENAAHRSTEIWGRGNGWVIVTLTQIVESLPKTHPKWPTFAGYLKEMLVHLPELQDSATGHWFQLPAYPHVDGNYIESSCTAMFGYGIAGALRLGIVEGEAYEAAVDRAYQGLPKHSLSPRGKAWLGTLNVCQGTCIGDQEYYFKRKAKAGMAFGVGMVILFGRAY
ncbi:MAG: Rhamnogalacturonan exolyase YesX [Bacteroidota bacterium]|jgi:unsaturated rhamnogalacturonyl hydrolase